MQFRSNAFDIWVFSRAELEPRYLLLHTSEEKAKKWFGGGRFWQIPSDFIADDEKVLDSIRRCLSQYALVPKAIWAVEHTYVIYNRRHEDVELILVFAAEVEALPKVKLSWEHSEYRWLPAAECQQLLGFRGLREGLEWTQRFVTEAPHELPELRLL